MREIKAYLSATKEVIWSTSIAVFLFADILAFIVDLIGGLRVPRLIYPTILLIGYIFSTLQLVVNKNYRLSKKLPVDLFIQKVKHSAGVIDDLKVRNCSGEMLKDFTFAPLEMSEKYFHLQFQIKQPNILQPGEARAIDITPNENVRDAVIASLNPKWQTKQNYPIIITYKDVNNNTFRASFVMGKEITLTEIKNLV